MVGRNRERDKRRRDSGQRRAPALFSHFRARDCEAKKSAKNSGSAECELVLFPSFVAPHWTRDSRAQIHSAGEKARVLKKQYGMSLPSTTCPFRISVLYVHAACLELSPCCMSMLLVHSALPFCTYVHAACPCLCRMF